MQHTGTFQDRYDLPLSTSSGTAVKHYSEGIDRLLSLNADSDLCLARAIEADEGFALAHAARAFLLQTQGNVREAMESVGRARTLAPVASRRERLHVDAIATAISG